MKLKRVEHVAIAVNDMAESMKMLQDTLGIEMEYEEQIGATRLAMFPIGETYLEVDTLPANVFRIPILSNRKSS